MDRNIILTPGPTKIAPEIYEALAKPIIHHRTPQFQEILKEVGEGLVISNRRRSPPDNVYALLLAK